MGEENGPIIADPFMKVDGALRCLSGKVWSHIVDSECHVRCAFRGFTPCSIFWCQWADKRKPTQLKSFGWVLRLLEDVYFDSLTHTLAGLQQQRQHIEVVLAVIVIASNLLYRR
jgi:hypothetical protein